jgi:hypothetical protein
MSETIVSYYSPMYPTGYYKGPIVTDEVLFNLDELVNINLQPGWTDISNNVFMNKESLLSITIPYTLTTIGNRAFKNAIDLSSIVLNNTDICGTEHSFELTSIGDEAFQNTFKLTQLRIPASVTTLGANVFKGSGLTSITFDTNSAIESLTASTFEGATALSEIIFLGTTNYTTSNGALYTNDMTKLIMYYSKDTAVTTFTVPNTVTHIEDGAFQYSTHLTEILFRNDGILTHIGSNAFRGLSALTEMTLPNTVRNIGSNAFNGLSGLTSTSFTIPNIVSIIEPDTFRGLSSLTEFIVDDASDDFSVDTNGVLFDKNKTILIQYPLGKPAQSYTILSTVTTINERALEYAKITTFSVEDGSTTFICDASGVLYNSTYSTLIQYPLNSQDTIYTINEYVTSIYKGAFNDANNLTTLNIPKSVRDIKLVEFENMTELQEFGLNPITSENNSYTYVSYINPSDLDSNKRLLTFKITEGVLYSHDNSSLLKYPCKKTDTSYNLLDSVDVINAGAFSNATNLTSFTSNLVKTILPYAFKNCTGLTYVRIRRTTTSIGNNTFEGAFNNAYNIDPSFCRLEIRTDEHLTIGEDAFKNSNVNTVIYEQSYNFDPELYRNIQDTSTSNPIIFKRSFYGMNSVNIQIKAKYFTQDNTNILTSVLWPSTDLLFDSTDIHIKGYSKIGNNTFSSASNIETVTFDDVYIRMIGEGAFNQCTNLKSFTIPNRVTKISANVFEGTTNMTSIIIHDKITDISGEAFKNSGITDIHFPNSLINISSNAFDSCTDLSSITIPPSVTSIGEDAFINCTGLQTVTFDETTNFDSLGLLTIGTGTGKNFFGATSIDLKVTTHVFNVNDTTTTFTSRDTPTLLLTSSNDVNDNSVFYGSIKQRNDISGNYTHVIISFPQKDHDLPIQRDTYTFSETNDDGELWYLNAYDFYQHEYNKARGMYILPGYFPNIQSITFYDTSMFNDPYSTNIYNEARVPAGINAGTDVISNLFAEDHNDDTTTTVNYDADRISIVTSKGEYNALLSLFARSTVDRYKNTRATKLLLTSSITNENEYIPESDLLPINIIRKNIRTIEIAQGNFDSTTQTSVVGIHDLFPNVEEVIITSARYLGDNCIGPKQTTLTLPMNVELITSQFAKNATHLTTVIFESSFTLYVLGITHGVNQSFYGAPNIVDIRVTNHAFNRYIDADIYKNNGELVNAHLPFTGEYTAPTTASVTGYATIGENAFENTISLTSVNLNTTITLIKSGAFKNTYFDTIYIPTSVVIIGDRVFNNSSITSITFDYDYATLNTIGAYAFEYSKLTSITIPKSVTHIGEGAFSKIATLTSVTFANQSTHNLAIPKKMFQDCSGITSIEIPAWITSIGEMAFQNCSSLHTVTFLSNTSNISIGAYAFQNCPALTNIKVVDASGNFINIVDASGIIHTPFPMGITDIGPYAFAGSSLTSCFYFPLEMECTIQDYAFSNLINPINQVTFQPYISDIEMDGTHIFKDTTIGNISMTSYDIENFALSVVDDNITDFFGAISSYTYTDTSPSNTPICFPAGTPVRTNVGDIAIDKLDPDIHTIRNKRIVAITQSQPLHTYIVNIEKNALATNVPNNNTQISKEHKVYYKGQMVKAKDLVKICKGVTKIPYTGEILYNVLMEQHDKMMINNLICETLHPENIMARIHNGNYNTQEKQKLYTKLSSLIKKGDIADYNKFCQSI